MNLSQVLRALGKPQGQLPREAVRWALDHWSIVVDPLLQTVARVARNPADAPEKDLSLSYFALHLLAEKGESRAFPLLCALMRAPEGAPDIFGDATSLTLPPVLIALFDGEAAPLLALAANKGLDFEIRGVAMAALAYLTAAGRIEREATERLLRALYDAEAAHDPMVLDAWAGAVAMLGSETLMPLVKDACATGRIDSRIGNLADYMVLYNLAREEPDPLAPFEREDIRPLTDALTDLERIERILSEPEEGAQDADEDTETYEAGDSETAVNPFRGVGRNDPCPCGSGKKFKKCCMPNAA